MPRATSEQVREQLAGGGINTPDDIPELPRQPLAGHNAFRSSQVNWLFPRMSSRAENNMVWSENTKFWEIEQGAFGTAVRTGEPKGRQAEVKQNMEREQRSRVRHFLWGDSDSAELDWLRGRAAPQLVAEVCKRAGVSRAEARRALVSGNRELGLAMHAVAESGVELPPDAFSGLCGVVSADVAAGYGGAVLELGCESVGASLTDEFLDLAKALSRTAAVLPLGTEDPKHALLSGQLEGSSESVADAIVRVSVRLREAVALRGVYLIPWPPNSLLGWHVHNPRPRHSGQGGSISFVMMGFHPHVFTLEPEWGVRLQEGLPSRLARHCCVEPLLVGAQGRLLKQKLCCPLPPHEEKYFPAAEGAPTLYDWMQHQLRETKCLWDRIGIVDVRVGMEPRRTWLNYSAERWRYYKFQRDMEPAPDRKDVQSLVYRKSQHAKPRTKEDFEDEELWYNEPGERDWDHAEDEGEDGGPELETDDELMRSGENPASDFVIG